MSTDLVTRWSRLADRYGDGAANWRTLAIMHMAMHDALNAVQPVYARWAPPAGDEPPPGDARPEVAMVAAAEQVLLLLHPDRQAETNAAFSEALRVYPSDAATAAGQTLGSAIGRAAVERRAKDGFDTVTFFQSNRTPGRWRPTPVGFATSRTNESRPFLFASARDVPDVPPPALGSPEYLRQRDEVRRLGAVHSRERTDEQTEHAVFWAYQSSQRGFLDLAVRLIEAAPPPGGIHAQAHILGQLTVALADSAILTWHEKAKYAGWRPVSAMRVEGVDAGWVPLVETPPFPEYPSGHATDCDVGAGILAASFPDVRGSFEYVSSAFMPPRSVQARPLDFGMGQHAQSGDAELLGGREQRFSSFAAAAQDCANSRIWAGAHFAAAEEESARLAKFIVDRALAATPLLDAQRTRGSAIR